MGVRIVLCEIEERIMLQHRVLKVIALDGINLDVWSNSATTINRATAVRQLHFLVRGVIDSVAVEVVVIQRHITVVALNQPPTWCVVLGRRQCQTRIVR